MVRFSILAAAASLALTACAADVREEPLATFDLSQPAVIEAVLARLPAESRGAFATYTIHHLASSSAFCGDVLIDERGQEPVTVGEAIRLTIAREAELAEEPEVIDPATLNPVDRHRYELAQAVEAHGYLIDERENALMIEGEGARGEEAFIQMEEEIATSTKRIAAIRKAAPAGSLAP